MEPVCIDRGILGTERHLVCDDGYRWTQEVPDDAWHLSGGLKDSRRCLDTLLALNGETLATQPPEQFVRMMETCASGSLIPWQRVMPRSAHLSFARALVSQAEESLSRLDRDYYEGTWARGGFVLQCLRPAHVDRKIWKRLMDERVGNWRVVQTFKPDARGECRPVAYNRFGTRTGRLTVERGPSILTLKREYRSMLRSRYGDDGVIVYLDFSNLEARILLYESGGRCDDPDLYSFINRELFDGAMARDDIKVAVISELYGQGERALGRKLGLSGKHLRNFTRRIKGYFKTDRLLERVKAEFVEKGYITNRYGRRVEIDEPLDRIFINSYTQSTGVDVTMLGFNDVCYALIPCGIFPIFLLHDAMLLDVPKDLLGYVRNFESTGVTVKGYVQNFPLKLEFIGCTPDVGEVG